MIVGRQPVFAVFVGLDVEIGDDGWLSGHRLNDLCVEAQGFVGVGEVACRGHEKTEFGGRLRRPDDEHDIFFGDADSRDRSAAALHRCRS